ncbi:MAG: S46 family peptidase [Myxococcota bacterium]
MADPGLLGLVLLSVMSPPMEGWWPPEGPDPHPSALSEDVRLRVSEATVQLGDGSTGVLVSREGLVLTSAAAVTRCARSLERDRRPGGFLAPELASAPVCPGLNAYVHVEVQDVSRAVQAAARAGSDARPALVSACRRRRRGRRCRVVDAENGRARLVIERKVSPVRLRYFPQPDLLSLGSGDHARSRPRLRLDAALVSVGSGRPRAAAVPVRTSPVQTDEEVWIGHHPRPSLRWRSALEVEVFIREILPVYQQRAAATSDAPATVRRLETLAGLAPHALAQARRRELELLRRAAEDTPSLAQAFHRGRADFRALPWATWAGRTSGAQTGPPLLGSWADGLTPLPRAGEEEPETSPLTYPEALSESRFEAHHLGRAQALIGLPGGPVGPDGRGDLRFSRGVVLGREERPTWALVTDVAGRLDHELSLPRPLPWSPREVFGVEITADIGPRASGGPVLDQRGRLLAVVSGGDTRNLAGLFRFRDDATVSATTVQAILRALSLHPEGRSLAAELRD